MSRVRKERANMNPFKKISMLKRRLLKKHQVIAELEERNQNLASEVNNTKLSLANMRVEYNRLMSKNYEQAVQLNQFQEELIQIRNTYDSAVIEALKSVGTTSELLINLKNSVSQIKLLPEDWKSESPLLSSPSLTPRNDVSAQGVPVDGKRNQATVSPMVSGYVIGNPTITLHRLRLTPDEISAASIGSPRIEDLNACGLSPIEEEHPAVSLVNPEPIRTRLGRRNIPPQNPGNSPGLSDFIPEAHSNPVVRVSDVSGFLCRTSISLVNVRHLFDGSTVETSPTNVTPISLTSSGVNNIPVPQTSTVTLRQKKKRIKKSDETIKVDTSFPESFQSTSENIQRSPVDNMDISESDGNINHNEGSSDGEEKQENASTTVIRLPEYCDQATSNNNNNSSNDRNMSVNHVHLVLNPSVAPESGNMPILANVSSESPEAVPVTNEVINNTTLEEKNNKVSSSKCLISKSKGVENISRRKSSRKKKPSVRLTDICENGSTNSHDKENVLDSGSSSRRTTQRIRKPVKYLDEPLTDKEMKKILKKGLTKKQ